MKLSQRFNLSRSMVSAHHFPISQPMLTALEETWRYYQRTRILIPLDGRQRFDVFLLCLQHLLQYTPGKPLLVLSSASALPELTQRWQMALSIDGQLLARRFPFCFQLVGALGEQACLCFSTVRALQLQQLEDAEQLATRFDVIVVYDFPAHLSPVWKRVIEWMAARSLIVFCANPKLEVMQWCDTVITAESG